MHEPPLVYDLRADPFELYPVPPELQEPGLISTIKKLVRMHKKTLVPVVQQVCSKGVLRAAATVLRTLVGTLQREHGSVLRSAALQMRLLARRS